MNKVYSLWYLAIMLLIMNVGLAQISGTYTINSQAATGGTNFNNFYDAIQTITSKGINGNLTINIAVGTGPYTEQVTISKIPGANIWNRVTINGQGETLKFSPQQTAERHVLFLDSTEFLTIQDLKIVVDSNANYGWAVHLNETVHIEINNCDISCPTTSSSSYFMGIHVGSSPTSMTAGSAILNTVISGNKISGGYHGVHIRGVSNSNTDSVSIVNNDIVDYYSSGVYIYRTDHTVINNNVIHRPNRETTGNTNMIYLYRDNYNSHISNNVLKNANGGSNTKTKSITGIYVYNCDAPLGQENYITNNVFSGAESSYRIYGLNCYSSEGLYVYHNTFNIPESDFKSSDIRGVYLNSTNDNIEFVNNLINIEHTDAKQTFGIYMTSLNNTSLKIDYNNIFITDKRAQPNFFMLHGNNAYRTLQDWQNQSTSNYHQNSISVDPKVTTIHNLPVPTSFISDNKGFALTNVSNDILGNPRDVVSPDIGAIEFDPPDVDLSIVDISQININCSGKIALEAEISNNGSLSVDSLFLEWSVNGGPAMMKRFKISLSPNQSVKLMLDSISISGKSSIQSWISIPNVTDRIAENDTIEKNDLFVGVSGNFTIDQTTSMSLTNYHSIDSLFDFLGENGICGPVQIDVKQGTGPYYENVTIPHINGSSTQNNITLNGHDEKLIAGGNKLRYSMVQFVSASHVTFQNMVIETADTAKYGWIIQFKGSSHNNRITNCTLISPVDTLTKSNFSGIVFSDDDTYIAGGTYSGSNSIRENTFIRGYYGVFVQGQNYHGFYSNGNRIEHNSFMDVLRSGVELKYTENSIVSYNNISRPNVTKTWASFRGIDMSYYNANCEIFNNQIHNPNGSIPSYANSIYGINIYDVKPSSGNENKLFNNLIYNMNGNGLLNGITIQRSENLLLAHNTISLDRSDSASVSVIGLSIEGSSKNIQFQNNILSCDLPSISGDLKIINLNGVVDSLHFGHNVYHAPSIGVGSHVFAQNGQTKYTTLADWQIQGVNFDSASISTNPNFPDAINGLVQPSNDSISNMGIPLPFVTMDFFDVMRSLTQPDPGAIEFDSNDVAIVGIHQNTLEATCLNDSAPIIIDVLNNSTRHLSTIPITVLIKDASNSWTIDDTITVSLKPGQIYGYHPLDKTTSRKIFSYDGTFDVRAVVTYLGDTRSYNDTVNVQLDIKIFPTAPIGLDTAVCKNVPFSFNTNKVPSATYYWYHSYTDTNAFQIGDTLRYGNGLTENDSLYYKVISNGGCESSMSILNIEVVSLAQASFNFSNDGLKVEFQNSSVPLTTKSQYVWEFGDGKTSNELHPTHTYSAPGTYEVTLNLVGYCNTDFIKQVVDLSTVGISAFSENDQLRLFPNPSEGQFYISVNNGNFESAMVSIYHLNGQIVEEKMVRFASNQPVLFSPKLAKGTYLVAVRNESNSIQKIITIH